MPAAIICINVKSTKAAKRSRRDNTNLGREIEFNRNTIITISQNKFWSRNKNKKRLIELLCGKFEKEKCSTVVAEEDADFLIVSTTGKCNVSGTTWIIGEDIDLLVILTQHTPINTVYFLKLGKGNVNDGIYGSRSFKYPELQKLIGFLHAFTGFHRDTWAT